MCAIPSPLSRFHITVAALLLTAASASPAYRRADTTTDSGLEPWVTVPASGSPSTVTPHLTTVSGVATTIDAAPASLTATTTDSSTTDSTSSTTSTSASTSTPTDITGGAFEICHNSDGDNAPFCDLPNNNTVYVGHKYYITWDTSYYSTSTNSTCIVSANYANATLSGQIAWDSAETLNNWGFVIWTPDASILQDGSENNVTLFITNLLAVPDQAAVSRKGPEVVVTNKPHTPYPAYTTPPKRESLYIALPIVLSTVLIFVVGMAVVNRKTRRIGLGNVMGRNRGYAAGKSKRERLGLKKGGVKLREQELRVEELRAEGEYRDAPVPLTEVSRDVRAGHQRGDSDGLGSLVESPVEERERYFGERK